MPIYSNNISPSKIYSGGRVDGKVYNEGIKVWPTGGSFEPITFGPSDELQEWIVPSGITQVKVTVAGSKGFRPSDEAIGDRMQEAHKTQDAGHGAIVNCILDVSSFNKLNIYVGKAPNDFYISCNNSSDIRSDETLESRLIVAGGGGGMGYAWEQKMGEVWDWAGGGHGGYPNGEKPNECSVNANDGSVILFEPARENITGGTQTEGGSIPNYGEGEEPGQLGLGGKGAYATDDSGQVVYAAGHGGGGYYGGGGGHWFDDMVVWIVSGGGGGSSYTNENYCTEVVHTNGGNNGEGYITIEMAE